MVLSHLRPLSIQDIGVAGLTLSAMGDPQGRAPSRDPAGCRSDLLVGQSFVLRDGDAAQACADTYPAQAAVPHHAPYGRARRADPTRELIWALIGWGDNLRARCGAPTLAGRTVLVHEVPLRIRAAQ